jgi:hypothetical protein
MEYAEITPPGHPGGAGAGGLEAAATTHRG